MLRTLALTLLVCWLPIVGKAYAQATPDNIVIRPAQPKTFATIQIDVPVQVCEFGDPMFGTSTSVTVVGQVVSITANLTHFLCFSSSPVTKAITFTIQPLPAGIYTVNYARSVDGVLDHQESATFNVSFGVIPVVGMWWNPVESGSGYSIDVKHDVLVMTVFSYIEAGSPQWYLFFGPLVNNTATGKLLKFAGGQCISCNYQLPMASGDDGSATVTFTSPTTATLLLPGGRVTQIVPHEF